MSDDIEDLMAEVSRLRQDNDELNHICAALSSLRLVLTTDCQCDVCFVLRVNVK